MMNSREIAKSGAICDQTPFPAAKPSVIYGRVMVPANGMGEGQVSFGEGGIRLGGAFAQIKLKAEEEDRERRRVEDRAKAAIIQAERLSMSNEDLVSQNNRLSVKLSVARMSDLTSETRADEVESENEALRIMHRNAIVELEMEKANNAELVAKHESLQKLADNNNSRARKLDNKVDEGEERFRELREKLIKAEGHIKKLQTQLGDERKKSQLYLKLKDDKDAHINVLVKEKNRLHDTLQDMAKRHSLTSRSLAFAEKAAQNSSVSSPRPSVSGGIDGVASVETPNTNVNAEEKKDGEVDLDAVVNSPYETSAPRPTNLFRSPNEGFAATPTGREDEERTQGLIEAISSIEVSSGSTRDRLLLNTIKKLSREMKRKEEEVEKREREWEKTKIKNDELQRRIRNANVARQAGKGLTTTPGVGFGGKKGFVVKSNMTPQSVGKSPN
ncbi:hypothetical protein TrST_g12145 [Triparma strigata]|uniref:Uncharacterized protein n=1 Tax=Triparma strigata TaxID=1606541 RepID=A0A9W7EJF1_9STRA|nr:hypothetical protein TrST_g12145 [Triparma strigata]